MMVKILCVAEKNSIAKAVAGHLAGGRFTTTNTGNQYIKNYSFTFDFGRQWGACNVVMTSVSGHLTEARFPDDYKNWEYPPPESLFEAPVRVVIDASKKSIATNITQNSRGAKVLFIWTDCDREGEHIGGEIRNEALKGNANLLIWRARFSNIERAHVIQAAKNPTSLDDRQVNAVSARIEIDLRIGLAFTRYLTLTLRPLGEALSRNPDGKNRVISYGSCQFPTLGFVVDRYFRVRNFVPEKFWSIKVVHHRENTDVVFKWRRNRLFRREAVVIFYERCLAAKMAKVIKVQEKPTSKWKPLPLTTVEFQKMASRFLHMNGQEAMNHAEALYQKGFISYPRTETDRFDSGINLRALVEKQVQDSRWGSYSQGLLDGAFVQPRQGRNDDKAHPPIHPVTWVSPSSLNPQEARVYEFIARRFLACCSDDAKGQATNIDIEYGEEIFDAHGVVVLARNYLDVYPYEKWNSTAILPRFTMGERFEPTEAVITEGKTTAPGYLTEPDLISLMDANGIGTDATMAEHIAKIKERGYVFTRPRGVNSSGNNDEDQPQDNRRGRGRGRGRGSRGGRGGRGDNTSVSTRNSGVEEFIPSTLGVALVDGYDRMGFEISLSKPFLRKEMELRMKDICEGRITRDAVLQDNIRQYRRVFEQSKERVDILRASCRRYVLGEQ
ncbi:DNA topoisomerase 3 [Erysiphe neolycopersici]|uniref:DNA topoisomerase n=1 Tax=Erysiphe neolycopersici TaxID=212602 RepID=A0A420I7F2_9PEZI|nr:DNA topoisomerase 3 [Erysiphe neolycopersici]